ncbi:MAG: hypothetical protein P8R37_09775 [Opitutae bacterium]|nr:hypothetical protein [Opitutae bacterium]MDG1301862.1 hypothetical protein [Opitutae bacterium]
MNYKRLTALSAALLFASTANAEWKYGVGTGLGLASYDGDVTIDGTAKLDVEYDQDDFEGGFGGAAFATDGTWVFNLSGSTIEYESKDTIKGATSGRTKNNFERTFAEFTVGYVAYREDAITLTPYLGLNYTSHDWEIKGSDLNTDFDDSWVDAVFGLKFDYKINDEWTWNNSAEYTAGDSEGCFGVKTGASWKFAENWVAGAYVSLESDEFEGKHDGQDFDYDTDVTTFGLTIAYVW